MSKNNIGLIDKFKFISNSRMFGIIHKSKVSEKSNDKTRAETEIVKFNRSTLADRLSKFILIRTDDTRKCTHTLCLKTRIKRR